MSENTAKVNQLPDPDAPKPFGALSSLMIIFLYEFFGTACVIYACICSGGNIFSWPFTLLIYLLVARPINGGHANPAVTLGFYVYEVMKGEEGRTFW